MMVRIIFVAVAATALAGCAGEVDRIASCEAKGISKEICYQEERADQRAERNRREIQLKKQNEQTIKDMGIKGLGLPK